MEANSLALRMCRLQRQANLNGHSLTTRSQFRRLLAKSSDGITAQFATPVEEKLWLASVACVQSLDKWLLILSNAKDDRNGKWCWPGGHVEPGETIRECAKRECEEETGIVCEPIRQHYAFNRPHIAFFYCRATPGQELHFDKSEAKDAGWFTLEQMKALDLHPNVMEMVSKETAESEKLALFATDASGHEHRGKGPGGGQFVGESSKIPEPHREAVLGKLNAALDEPTLSQSQATVERFRQMAKNDGIDPEKVLDEQMHPHKAKNANVKPPWEMTPDEFVKSGVKIFRTGAGGPHKGKGSLYAEMNGQTMRIKALHIYHDPKDVGLKSPSTITYYIDPNSAREVGMWQSSSAEGKKAIHNRKTGEILLTSINRQTGKRGLDGRIKIKSEQPAIGLSPFELFQPSHSVLGGYNGTHPGTDISSIEAPTHEHHKEFVEAAKKWTPKSYLSTLVEDVVELAIAHAPAGGISIAGKDFIGGQFIPAEVLAEATPEEKARLDSPTSSDVKPEPSQPDEPDHAATVGIWLKDIKHIPEEKRQAIAKALIETLDRMPAPMAKAALDRMGGPPVFYSSMDDVTDEYKRRGEKVAPDEWVGGFCDMAAKLVHIDHGIDGDHDDAVHTYAHEWGHILDGGYALSRQPAWRKAYHEEIKKKGEPLSEYALVSAAEGWAELIRAVVTEPEAVRRYFPKCWEFLQNQALVD